MPLRPETETRLGLWLLFKDEQVSGTTKVIGRRGQEALERVVLRPGMIVELKKPHPCGANAWEIIRLGMDVKLRCTHCGRYVRLERLVCERRVRKILSETPLNDETQG